jgi:hypothetical protein
MISFIILKKPQRKNAAVSSKSLFYWEIDILVMEDFFSSIGDFFRLRTFLVLKYKPPVNVALLRNLSNYWHICRKYTLLGDRNPTIPLTGKVLWMYVMPQNMDCTALDTLDYLIEFGGQDIKAAGVSQLSKVVSLHKLLGIEQP